ncbi:MAG: 5-(carboxyamino)imidazole ribonucleotide synthase [Elainellaceae cyanobacterium]
MLRRVGVIGGGQLAAMMGGGAQRLGVDLIVQTPQAIDPAVAIASETILAPVDDADATARLAERCDLITFENEFINLDALRPLEKAGVQFYPRLDSLAPLLDKYDQRSYLKNLGLPTPQFIAINKRNLEEPETLSTAIPFKFPVVLKARRHGYDGQGTFIVKSLDDLNSVIRQSGVDSWLLEEFIPFERELAVMVARSGTGEIVVYPVVETQQENQVCRRVFVLNDIDPSVSAEVGAIARTLMDSLQVTGIFGIELFLTQSGDVLVNEIAPRTHNSGHYTLDACATSQFEQHLRAVCHLSLGHPHLRCQAAVMVNLLGYEYANQDYAHQRQQLAMLPQTFVHWYGKTESRPGRKLGHVTALLDEPAIELQRSQAVEIAQKIEKIWYP